MRIVLAVHHYLDPDAGAPGVTLHLAEEYRRNGHDVRCVSFDDLPRWVPARWCLPLFCIYLLRFAPALVFGWIDVIDASTGDGSLLGLVPRAARAGLLVCRSHGLEQQEFRMRMTDLEESGGSPTRKDRWYWGGLIMWMVSTSLRRSDVALVLNGADERIAVEEVGCRPGRVHLVRNGINARLLAAASGARSPRHLCFIGTWLERKGVAALPDVLRSIAAQEGVSLTIAGCGVPEDTIRRCFDADLGGAITVVPRYDNPDLGAAIGDAGILVFPSRSEGYGIAVAEALALGLVPASYRTPGPARIIEDAGVGALVDVGHEAELVEQIVALVRLPLSEFEAMSEKARSWGARQVWAEVAEEQLSLYQRSRQGAVTQR